MDAKSARDLDYARIRALRKVHLKGVWPSMCRQMLVKLMASKDPEFSFGDDSSKIRRPSRRFKELLDQFWKPFVLDCMDELMIVGIVVVKFKKVGEGDMVPIVISSEHFGSLYDVKTRYDPVAMQTVYEVWKNFGRDGQYATPVMDRKAIVLRNFGWDPAASGEFYTHASRVEPLETYMAHVLQMSYVAEYNLARPAIVTETTLNAPQRFRVEEGVYIDHDGDRRDPDSLYRQTVEDPRYVEFDDAVRGGSLKERWRPNDDHEFDAMPTLHNNVTPLPPNHTVSQIPQPVRNPHFDKITHDYEVKVSAIYGIPRSMIAQDTGMRAASSTDLVHEELRHTIAFWSTILSRIYTNVYNYLYMKDHWNMSLGKTLKMGQPMAKDDLFASVDRKAEARVSIPVPPMIPLEQMHEMYERRLMEWDEYFNWTRLSSGMGQRPAPPEPPRPEEIEKRQAIELAQIQAKAKAKEQGSGERKRLASSSSSSSDRPTSKARTK